MSLFLKSIELKGFKSFGNPSLIEFNQDVTGIIGPNGCGKSNVIEAIRWVLGEQSAKNLRGERMQDVIFNGTKFKSSLGMASIQLTFDNTSKWLPIDFDEVEISRRIFRSGEGQYFINKSRSRLKDILELFMNTGIGKDSYTIFEQGKIDRLLSESPSERRLLFEEFAGISKFKFKKEDALRKLEQTKENCEKVDQLLLELEKEYEKLETQAQDAKKYQSLKIELNVLEKKFVALRVQNMEREILKRKVQIQKLEEKIVPLEERLKLFSKDLEDTDSSLHDISLDLQFEESALYDSEKKLIQTKSDLTQNQNQTEMLKQNIKNMYLQIEKESKRKIELEKNLENLQNTLYQKNNEIKEASSKVVIQSEKIKNLKKEKEALNKTFLEKSKNLGFSHILSHKEIEELKTKQIKLSFQQESKIKESETLKKENETLKKEINNLKEKIITHELTLNKQKETVLQTEKKIENFKLQENSLKEEIVNAKKELKFNQNELNHIDEQIISSLDQQFQKVGKLEEKKPLLKAKINSSLDRIYKTVKENSSLELIQKKIKDFVLQYEILEKEYEDILGILYSDTGSYTQKKVLKENIEDLAYEISHKEINLDETRQKREVLQKEFVDIFSLSKSLENEFKQLNSTIFQKQDLFTKKEDKLLKLKKESEDITSNVEDKLTHIKEMEDSLLNYQKTQALILEKINKEDKDLSLLKMEESKLEEFCDFSQKEHSHTQKQLNEILFLEKNFDQEVQKNKNNIEDFLKKSDAIQIQIKETASILEEKKENIQELKENKNSLENTRLHIHAKLIEMQNELQKSYNEITQLETIIEERNSNLESVLLSAKDSYEGDIKNVLLSSDDNIEDISKATTKLRTKLTQMGNVNLLAIEQFQDLKERILNLKDQKEDIMTAIANIVTTIEQTNKESSEIFLRSFQMIRQSFKELFSKLFNGGRADLVLLDSKNPLSSGIDIKAEPPGQKFQSISLLSGGQRAMVAIAVIFSILLLKPAPFVILDEMDAALDDENIERFKLLLEQFRKKSQFVLVSHSKSTLEACDTLYGITMEELGCSKVISVSLQDSDKFLDIE